MKIKQLIGPGAIIFLVAVPVIMWAEMWPWPARFASYGELMTSFAQLTGLTGISLFATVLILGARVAWLEDYFGGLNRMYILHHWLGGLALILLLSHPLLTAAVLMPVSLKQAAALIWPLSSQAVLFGWLALGTMILLLVLTFYLRPGYQLWKLTHKFLGLAFFLGGLHAWLIPSDIARNWWLRVYVIGLVVVALSLYLRHSILNAHKKYLYRVERVDRLNDLVWRIVMVTKGEAMRYRAGQFAFFRFIAYQVPGEWHPFSLASGSRDNHLEIIVKDLGGFTHSLAHLNPGARVQVQGPHGRFDFRRGEFKEQVWIAGGIGLTPFIGMGKDLGSISGKYRIRLFFATRNQTEDFALDELKKMQVASGGQLQVIHWHSDEQGFLTGRKIVGMISRDMKVVSFYICGPGAMMSALREQLLAEGVAKQNIYTEEFEL